MVLLIDITHPYVTALHLLNVTLVGSTFRNPCLLFAKIDLPAPASLLWKLEFTILKDALILAVRDKQEPDVLESTDWL